MIDLNDAWLYKQNVSVVEIIKRLVTEINEKEIWNFNLNEDYESLEQKYIKLKKDFFDLQDNSLHQKLIIEHHDLKTEYSNVLFKYNALVAQLQKKI